MKSKLESSKDNLQDIIALMHCPICQADLKIDNNSLICINRHTFNISRKGITMLAMAMKDKVYNQTLFKARKEVLNSGLYDQVFMAINKHIKSEASVLLDAGTGEGTYLKQIKDAFPQLKTVGLDLAKDGLEIASDYMDSNWLLADLANIPFKSNSIDIILNVLSPANYDEFERVLKEDGLLIKIVVNNDYLKEIRQSIAKDHHTNDDVLNILDKRMEIISKERINYDLPITSQLRESLFLMTPMTHNSQDQSLAIDDITIDLELIIAKRRS